MVPTLAMEGATAMNRADESAGSSKTASRQVTTETWERNAEPHLFLVLQCDRPLAPPARYCLKGVEELTFRRSPDRLGVRLTELTPARPTLAIPDAWISS